MNNNAMDDSTRDLFMRGMLAAKANEAAKNRHFLGLISEQCHYNLANRMPEGTAR